MGAKPPPVYSPLVHASVFITAASGYWHPGHASRPASVVLTFFQFLPRDRTGSATININSTLFSVSLGHVDNMFSFSAGGGLSCEDEQRVTVSQYTVELT